MICPYCKSKIPNISKFCPNCGKEIKTKIEWEYLFLFLLIITIISIVAGFLIYNFAPKKEQKEYKENEYGEEENYDYERNYENYNKKYNEPTHNIYEPKYDIKVLAPNGNEKICKGSAYNIKWKILNPNLKNKYGRISIIKQKPHSLNTYSEYSLEVNFPLDKEIYQWNNVGFIEKYNIKLNPGNYYKIKVSASIERGNKIYYEFSDESDYYFSIINCLQIPK